MLNFALSKMKQGEATKWLIIFADFCDSKNKARESHKVADNFFSRFSPLREKAKRGSLEIGIFRKKFLILSA